MNRIFTFTFALVLGLFATGAAAVVTPGQPAPEFTATDSSGNKISLEEFSGHYVVLEWVNPSCPFTGKHYKSGNMQALQSEYTGKGVKWISVYSMPQSGIVTRLFRKNSDDMNGWLEEQGATPTALIMDLESSLAQMYGARTTPHMFVINPEGTVIYTGAIDDTRSTRVSDIASATNYVEVALNEALAGKPVTTAVTRPYGCAVKYD